MIFVGDDRAEDHHDIYLMDADGARLATRRLPEGLPSIGGFHELVAAHVEEPSPWRSASKRIAACGCRR